MKRNRTVEKLHFTLACIALLLYAKLRVIVSVKDGTKLNEKTKRETEKGKWREGERKSEISNFSFQHCRFSIDK